MPCFTTVSRSFDDEFTTVTSSSNTTPITWDILHEENTDTDEHLPILSFEDSPCTDYSTSLSSISLSPRETSSDSSSPRDISSDFDIVTHLLYIPNDDKDNPINYGSPIISDYITTNSSTHDDLIVYTPKMHIKDYLFDVSPPKHPVISHPIYSKDLYNHVITPCKLTLDEESTHSQGMRSSQRNRTISSKSKERQMYKLNVFLITIMVMYGQGYELYRTKSHFLMTIIVYLHSRAQLYTMKPFIS